MSHSFAAPTGLPRVLPSTARKPALPDQYASHDELVADLDRAADEAEKEADAGEYELIVCPVPLVLPAGWHEHERRKTFARFQCQRTGLRVILSACRERDQKRWLHVSLSYPNKMPSYEDLTRVKETFVGRDKTALQVFPDTRKHVNLHNFVLHLWHCLDGDVTPDFRKGGAI